MSSLLSFRTLERRGPFVGAMLVLSTVVSAQPAVPMRDLSNPEATSMVGFGNIFGVRALPSGKLLVNDGVRRQLVVLDDKMSTRTVVIDSVVEGGQSYGPRASPIIAYLGDSTLFVDGTSLSLLVLDQNGKVAHVMSAPKPSDLRFLAGAASGIDSKGNLLYRAPLIMNANRSSSGPPTPGQATTMPAPPDSASIVRANFDSRTVDTVGRVKNQSGTRTSMTQDGNGGMQISMMINPLNTVDEWAVLSDGSVAFVRGHDYHIDWLTPDGKVKSTPKLPFDWKRLTDEDKQALIDSARTAQENAAKSNAAAKPGSNGAVEAGMVAAMAGGGGATFGGGGGGGGQQVTIVMRGGDGGGGGGGGAPMVSGMGPNGAIKMGPPKIEFVPLKEIADYYPAIRTGAVKADMDGNLWVLTTTTAQSKQGELIYDVINNHGELFQRVRLPVGRSIAGFGRSGVVFLMFKDVASNSWFLERTKILSGARATD